MHSIHEAYIDIVHVTYFVVLSIVVSSHISLYDEPFTIFACKLLN